MNRWVLGLGLAAVLAVACGDFFAPPLRSGALSVVADFGATGLAQSDADLLRVRVFRQSDAGSFDDKVLDDTLAIDPDSGTAEGSLSVPILTSPQQVVVQLDAFRSSDGLIVFSGIDTVEVREQTGGGDPEPVSIRVVYAAPGAASVTLAPRDTVVEQGATFQFRAQAFDSSGAIELPVRYALVNSADAAFLTLNRLTGEATAASDAEAVVEVVAHSVDGLAAESTRVLIGSVPVGVLVTPGYGNVGVGASVALDGAVVDALNNPLRLFSVEYASRNPAIATVAADGVVTGVAAGTAVIVVGAPDFPSFADSALVTVAPDSTVVVSATSNLRGFQAVDVGDTVTVDVTVDMRFVAPEVLGSYNAVLSWNAAVLSFVDVQPGDFLLPETNTANTASGELRFAQADANGVAGVVVVASVRLVALASGAGAAAVSITELSAAQSFTNLLSQVIVTNGTVTVR